MPSFPVVRVVAERPAEKKIIVGGVLAPARLESRPRRASSDLASAARDVVLVALPSCIIGGYRAPMPATFASACRTAAGDVGSVRTVESGTVRSATRSVGGMAFKYWSIACFINRSFPGRNDPSSITRNVVRPSVPAPATLVPNGAGSGGPDGFAASPERAVVASTRSRDVRVR